MSILNVSDTKFQIVFQKGGGNPQTYKNMY